MPRVSPSSTQTPGKFNVYLPKGKTPQYLAFNTLAEAQAAVEAKKAGVILDPAGKLDPKVQTWSGWSSYQSKFPAAQVVLTPGPMPGGAQAKQPSGGVIAVSSSSSTSQSDLAQLNSQLKTARTLNQVSVWFPAPCLGRLGLKDPSGFAATGAYLAFDSVKEAVAHVAARTVGVVLDAQGRLDTTVPQQWTLAAQFGAQRLDAQVTASPTAHKHSVWIPPSCVSMVQLPKHSAFPNGAYLAFDSAQEAQAHVQARTYGVVLDTRGQFDSKVPQPWDAAGKFAAQLLSAQLTAQPTAQKFNVWIPAPTVSSLNLANTAPFARGAYLAFDSAEEAVAHAARFTFGVVLNPKGAPTADQPWTEAGPFIAQLSNSQLTQAPTAQRINVWFPPEVMDEMGLEPSDTDFSSGAFMSFATLTDAQAHVKERTFGVILSAKGAFDDSVQGWKEAPRYGARLLNPQLKDQPTAQRFNVWFPASTLHSLGLASEAPFSKGGAYLAFHSAAEAGAHVQARSCGAVLNQRGEFDTSVPQAAASIGDLKLRELIYSKLTDTRPTKQASVFFPAEELQHVGLTADAPGYPQGAYLPFDSSAAAIAYAQVRGIGAVLNAQGQLEPKQGFNSSTRSVAQQLNAQLQATRTPGQVNVWFPPDHAAYLGVKDTRPYLQGSYLAFDSLEAAQTHVQARNFGVVLDAQGNFEPAHQTWIKAGRYGASMLNAQLVADKPTQGPYVWFPAKVVTQLELSDTTPFASGGAFMSFASVSDAKEHTRQRDLGLVFDANGRYDAANQGWTKAVANAPLQAMWPPPPVGTDAQTPATEADLQGVFAQPNPGGAHIVVRTHNAQLGELLKYELYLTLNGSDMKVKDLGLSQMGDGYVHDAPFDISYADLNVILDVLGSKVTPGVTEFAVKVTWPYGHDQGAGGAGGQGAHRFPAP